MGGASWDAERVLSILADVATAAAIIAILIAAVQFIGEAKRRKEEFERLELARQEQAFEVVTTHYMNFLSMCMENPDLSLSQLSLKRAQPLTMSSPADERRQLVLFEYFFQLIEKVYVLYRANEIYEAAGTFDASLLHDDAIAAMKAEAAADHDLRHRQWWGWDDWIRSYIESPLGPSFADAWRALDNHETNDRGFMAYVNARIDLALEGAHGTRH